MGGDKAYLISTSQQSSGGKGLVPIVQLDGPPAARCLKQAGDDGFNLPGVGYRIVAVGFISIYMNFGQAVIKEIDEIRDRQVPALDPLS